MPSAPLPAATVVVPTYKERANLEPLVTRLLSAWTSNRREPELLEVLIVDDDSRDGSELVVQKLKDELPIQLDILVRTEERGLSSAVIHGFRHARGNVLVCMDADLQHPPERVPDIVTALESGASFALGTRYAKGNLQVDENWPMHRRIVSTGARMLAVPLSQLSDPMSGFFGVRAEVFRSALDRISPIGFKIGLEIYVKAGIQRHIEIPIDFGVRVHGESKLTGKVMVSYLLHLLELYQFRYPVMLPVIIIFLLLACIGVMVFLLS